jgi:hypothetical protein
VTRWWIKRAVYLFLIALMADPTTAWCAEGEWEGSGPFPVRNFQPIQLLFLGMPGDRAAVIKKGALDLRIELADTATVFDDRTPRTNVQMKLETVRSGLFFRYGLTDRLEVAVEVPSYYRYRGILEGAITSVEWMTTGLAPARKSLQATGFAFNVGRDGRTLFNSGDGEMGFGDTTFFGKYQFLQESEGKPAASVRVALKVPTGDASRVFGSGHPDVGVGLALEKRVAAHWILYGNLNGLFPTGPVAGLTVQPSMSAIVAAEYLWSQNLSFVGHFDYYSSPFHGTDMPVLDNGVTELTVGFNYHLRENLLWQVYGVENLDFIRGSAADFTLSTVMTYKFGP